jgi:hypothetical protein
MTIFAMPDVGNESRVRLRKVRRWLAVIVVPSLLVVFYLCLNSAGRLAELYRVLGMVFLSILVGLWNPFQGRDAHEEIAEKHRINSIEVDWDGLKLNWATWTKFIPRDEIKRVEEPPNGRGMYVRTRNRFAWYLIPRKTDRYEEIRGQFAAMGLPIVEAPSPSSLWGLLFAFLFCASILLNLLTQDRRILAVNFVLALIVGVAGVILANSWGGDRQLRRRWMLGSFLPAIFSVVSLIFPYRVK